jgi:hypothetical protein
MFTLLKNRKSVIVEVEGEPMREAYDKYQARHLYSIPLLYEGERHIYNAQDWQKKLIYALKDENNKVMLMSGECPKSRYPITYILPSDIRDEHLEEACDYNRTLNIESSISFIENIFDKRMQRLA